MTRVDERLARLLRCAEARHPGPEANRVLAERRAALAAAHGRAVLYEIVIAPEATWDQFMAFHVPRLTEHLLAKAEPLLGGPWVLLALWTGEEVHLLSAPAFFAAVAEGEGLAPAALRARVGAWRADVGLAPPLPGA